MRTGVSLVRRTSSASDGREAPVTLGMSARSTPDWLVGSLMVYPQTCKASHVQTDPVDERGELGLLAGLELGKEQSQRVGGLGIERVESSRRRSGRRPRLPPFVATPSVTSGAET